ncbi:MAG: hypothetical protein ACP6IP_09450 [Candidatus Njordarchaeia archaeon]
MDKQHRFTSLAIYTTITGIIYVLFGFLEILVSIEIIKLEFIRGDILGGFTLVVIGGILINGFWQLYRGETMGLSYPLVGTILGIGIGLLFTLVLLADATEYFILMNPDYENWELIHDLRPEIYLTVLLIPIAVKVYNLIKKEKIVTPV